jgi:sortase (surface protein transpeptidase)
MRHLSKWTVVAVIAGVAVVGTGVTAAVAAGLEGRGTSAASASARAAGSAGAGAPGGAGAGGATGAPSTPAATLPNDAAGRMQDPASNAKNTNTSTATPVSVHIPSINVNASLEDLHKDSTGALVPPTQWNDAGWFSDGVVPGHTGPAVIAGHVDSLTSAAIFYDLDELAPGDQVQVSMSDGSTLTFTVTGSEQAPKNAFPTNDVYGATPDAQLRLITCGGSFDKTAGHYTDNLIVFASLTGT